MKTIIVKEIGKVSEINEYLADLLRDKDQRWAKLKFLKRLKMDGKKD